MDKEKDTKNDVKALDQTDAGAKNQIKKDERKRWKYTNLTVWCVILAIVLVFVIVSAATGHVSYIKVAFYDVLVNNILAVPSILVGLITFIGYLLQKKAWYEALSGAFKAIVGYLVLQMGSTFLTGVSKNVMVTFGTLIGSNVVLLDTYTGWNEVNEVLGQAVSVISYVVLVGLAANILLVALKRFTNVRSVNVTGHVMFQQASCLVAVMWFWVFKDIENNSLRQGCVILTSGVLIGMYWGIFSNLTFAPTQKITNNAGFCVGHQQMLGVWCAYQAGKVFALNKEKPVSSIEHTNLKKGFRIFHDNLFTSTILMFIFFGILFLIIKFSNKTTADGVLVWDSMIKSIGAQNLFGSQHWVVQIIGMCFEIVAAIQILMVGARMFVAELQKSFLGISQKLIPGAAVAIDIAGTFSYGEKAVTFGFISGAIGNFLGIGLVILLGQVAHLSAFNAVIMVGFIPMFFDNAAMGLYANATGGWKACITVPFISGFINVLGALLVIMVCSRSGQIFTYGYNGMWDWNILWSGIMSILAGVPSEASMYLEIIIPIAFMFVALMTTTEPGKSTKLKRLIMKKWTVKDDENAAAEIATREAAAAERRRAREEAKAAK